MHAGHWPRGYRRRARTNRCRSRIAPLFATEIHDGSTGLRIRSSTFTRTKDRRARRARDARARRRARSDLRCRLVRRRPSARGGRGRRAFARSRGARSSSLETRERCAIVSAPHALGPRRQEERQSDDDVLEAPDAFDVRSSMGEPTRVGDPGPCRGEPFRHATMGARPDRGAARLFENPLAASAIRCGVPKAPFSPRT